MESRHVAPVRIGERGDEIVTGHGLPVMALEIEVRAAPEPVTAKIAGHHADNLGPLLIDGRRVEIVDFTIGFGADRMRRRAAVLGELGSPQQADITGALDALVMHVGREALVTIDRQAFFQRQLEPVSAGNAVAGPVVEIFMRHDGFDAVQILVRRGGRVGENELAVEDVQALVFHRPHVEMADGDDLEQVEVIFQPVGLLVPFHRFFQRLHGVAGQRQVALLDIDMEIDLAARRGGEAVGGKVEVTDDTGKQVAGLRMRVVPDREMTALAGLAGLDEIAVRQQLREGTVSLDAHCKHRHHVGAVGEEADAAEPLGLALGAIHPAGQIQPLERGVGLGMALRDDPDLAAVRQPVEAQTLGTYRPVGLVQHAAVHSNLVERQVAAVQDEGRVPRPLQLQHRGDKRAVFENADIEIGRKHIAGRRLVV